MFDSLLESYNPYFRMDNKIDKETMAPIFQFTSLTTGEVFEYRIPRTDVSSYNNRFTSNSIQDMISDLNSIITSHIRDIKIDKIIKDV
jgi:hypothetical protein